MFRVCTLLILGLLPRPAPPQALPGRGADPAEVRLSTADIDRFWAAYDLAFPWFDPGIFDSLYLRPASEGLRSASGLLLGDGVTFSRWVREQWDYYESVRPATLAIRGQETAIRAALYALKYLYPEARFPDVYFIIGRCDAMGLPLGDRLLINAEQFGVLPASPTRARRQAPPRYAADRLPQVVAREMVRRQMPATGPLPLLDQALREGIADLVCELVTGRPFRPELDAYARPREAGLWQAFQDRMRGWATEGWLYRDAREGPDNLGAWLGYRIARSFYEQAPDKREAIRQMIHFTDGLQFLEQSGYQPPGSRIAPIHDSSAAAPGHPPVIRTGNPDRAF